MASLKNDGLLARTVEGSLNYYDSHRGCGTAADKGLAARLSGHTYNIINNTDRHEMYLQELRNSDHFVDQKGRHTVHFIGARRRPFASDERGLMTKCLSGPDEHPRKRVLEQRRTEIQLAQVESSQDYGSFQERCNQLFDPLPPKRYSINNRQYANEIDKVVSKRSNKAEFLNRRGEKMLMSTSAPSLSLADPAGSLAHAARADARKEASQRMTESASVAPWQSANTYSTSMDATAVGRQLQAEQRNLSVTRVLNHDFGVTRKNCHYSSQDKLTRADPFFMRPRLGATSNSVKYDIVNNEQRWFRY